MGRTLEKITVQGFKSIRSLENFALDQELNILIGANGAGKSNFVEFFRVLRAMLERRLQTHITQAGAADGYFHHGIKFTKEIRTDLKFGYNRHAVTWTSTADNKLMIASEIAQYIGPNTNGIEHLVTSGALESGLYDQREKKAYDAKSKGPIGYVYDALSAWQVYHFHDTGMTAGMRRDVGLDQGTELKPDASNLAAFLYQWQNDHADSYKLLNDTIKRVAPYFDRFHLVEKEGALENTVRLTWRQKGSDYLFQPSHFSDGTIRFICLAACLLQPTPPSTIVLDEPEIGLHPQALGLLAGIMRSASKRMQMIVATQSPVLLSEFPPQQIVTVNQVNGASVFERLNAEALNDWLADYTVGDLWQKGVIQGGPNHA